MEQTTFPIQFKNAMLTDLIESNTLPNIKAYNLELSLTYSGSWRYFYFPWKSKVGVVGLFHDAYGC